MVYVSSWHGAWHRLSTQYGLVSALFLLSGYFLSCIIKSTHLTSPAAAAAMVKFVYFLSHKVLSVFNCFVLTHLNCESQSNKSYKHRFGAWVWAHFTWHPLKVNWKKMVKSPMMQSIVEGRMGVRSSLCTFSLSWSAINSYWATIMCKAIIKTVHNIMHDENEMHMWSNHKVCYRFHLFRICKCAQDIWTM